MSCADDVERFVSDTLAQIARVRTRAVAETFTDAVVNSPVKTGAFRDAWHPSIDVPDEQDYPEPCGREVTLARIQDVAGRLKDDETAILRNNRPYGEFLESGGSLQAPNGMVAMAVERFPQRVERIAREEGFADGALASWSAEGLKSAAGGG